MAEPLPPHKNFEEFKNQFEIAFRPYENISLDAKNADKSFNEFATAVSNHNLYNNITKINLKGLSVIINKKIADKGVLQDPAGSAVDFPQSFHGGGASGSIYSFFNAITTFTLIGDLEKTDSKFQHGIFNSDGTKNTTKNGEISILHTYCYDFRNKGKTADVLKILTQTYYLAFKRIIEERTKAEQHNKHIFNYINLVPVSSSIFAGEFAFAFTTDIGHMLPEFTILSIAIAWSFIITEPSWLSLQYNPTINLYYYEPIVFEYAVKVKREVLKLEETSQSDAAVDSDHISIGFIGDQTPQSHPDEPNTDGSASQVTDDDRDELLKEPRERISSRDPPKSAPSVSEPFSKMVSDAQAIYKGGKEAQIRVSVYDDHSLTLNNLKIIHAKPNEIKLQTTAKIDFFITERYGKPFIHTVSAYKPITYFVDIKKAGGKQKLRYEERTYAELKQLAAGRGLKSRGLKKVELIAKLREARAFREPIEAHR